MDYLAGKKTYIVAFVAIVTAAGGMATGEIGIADGAQAIITALLGATIRDGIAKKG